MQENGNDVARRFNCEAVSRGQFIVNFIEASTNFIENFECIPDFCRILVVFLKIKTRRGVLTANSAAEGEGS